jgi:hypothetical protein
MTALKYLAAAAVLALSAHAATACDDYADEMAMAEAKAAQQAAKVVQAPQPAPSVAAPATGVASVEPKPAETAGTVQR